MIITVPAGVCPLLVVAVEEEVKDARIFVDEAVVKHLRETAYNEVNCYEGEDLFLFDYEVLGQEDTTQLGEISIADTPSCRTWYKVREFKLKDSYYKAPRNPKLTIYVKMA